MMGAAIQGKSIRGGRDDNRLIVAIVLALAVAVFVGLRICCATIPLERDEGEYAYVAQRMLAGEIPYRDAFDQKPPGVFFVFLIPVLLFGPSTLAIHLTLYLWTAATCVAVYLVAREIAGSVAAAWAVLVFSLISIEPAWLATAANTEQFMLLPMTLSVWLVLRGIRSSSWGWWVAAGAAAMAACWFKQVAATNIGFLAALAVVSWRRQRAPWQTCVAGAGAFAGGVAAVAAPVAAYFAIKGAWSPFVDCVWRHNLGYATSATWSAGRRLLIEALANQRDSLWFVWLLAGVSIVDWRRSVRREAAFCGAWLLFSVAGVSIGFYFRHHYFLQLAPVISVAAGLTCVRTTAWLRSRWCIVPMPVVVVGIALLVVAPSVAANRELLSARSAVEQSRILYGHSAFGENGPLAAVIRANTSPGDRVLVFGSEPQLLFLAERKSATRYIFFYPLMMDLPGAEERQREAFGEIEASRPACIVWTHIPTSLLMQPGSSRYIEDRVGALIDAEYRLVALRRIDGGGVSILTDPGEVNAALEARKRDPEATVLDLLVFVRKAPLGAINPRR